MAGSFLYLLSTRNEAAPDDDGFIFLSECSLTISSCSNGGTLDPDFCECVCPEDYTGETCEGKNDDLICGVKTVHINFKADMGAEGGLHPQCIYT